MKLRRRGGAPHGTRRRSGITALPLILAVVFATAAACTPVPLPTVALAPAEPSLRIQANAVATPGSPTLAPDGVYLPSQVDPRRPTAVVLALHGMGGTGGRIAQRLQGCADQNHWIVVAPTIAYRDYMDPAQVLLDDEETLPLLRGTLDSLSAQLGGVRLADRVYVYGFSRGAQLANRFAFFYPDHVAAVATLSGGSYTVPRRSATVAGQDRPLDFPFGVADLDHYAGHPFDTAAVRRIPFWVGVGSADTVKEQVPRSWDALLGDTRVERAKRFSDALKALGASVKLDVFSGVGHDETAPMRADVCSFFAGHPSSAS